MTVKTASPPPGMIKYRRMGGIDYDSLDFDPYESVEKPDAMEQHIEQYVIFGLLFSYFAEYGERPDVFVDFDSNICYDPDDLRRHVSPDVYLVFNVDAAAIRSRLIYLPWEAGKPPDFVVEVASRSTAQEDVERKPAIYEMINAGEYWMFDPTGGRYYGNPLRGRRLVDGRYQDIELTREPDGVLKGYSEALGLSVAWDNGFPYLYDHASGEYIENHMDIAKARRALEAQRDAEAAQRRALENQRDATEAQLGITEAQLAAEVRARMEAEEEREAEVKARMEAEEERESEARARAAAEEENRRLREQIRRMENR